MVFDVLAEPNRRRILDELREGERPVGALVTALTVPPLRDRDGDIDLLVAHFNSQIAARHSVPMRTFTPEVMDALRALPWLGNVRELRNVVENLLLTGSDPVVSLHELALDVQRGTGVPALPAPVAAPLASLHEAEQDTVARALRQAHGNIAGAARLLQISRSTLYRKIERHGLDRLISPP